MSLKVLFTTEEQLNYTSSRRVSCVYMLRPRFSCKTLMLFCCQAFIAEDVVPPLRNTLLIAFTPLQQTVRSMLRFRTRFAALHLPDLPSGAHHPALVGPCDLHQPVGQAYFFGEGQRDYWWHVTAAPRATWIEARPAQSAAEPAV